MDSMPQKRAFRSSVLSQLTDAALYAAIMFGRNMMMPGT